MNAVLEDIVRTGQVQTPDKQRRLELNSSISVEKGRFLQGIIEELGAEVTLETGCCFGVSGMWIWYVKTGQAPFCRKRCSASGAGVAPESAIGIGSGSEQKGARPVAR